ncbi:MAG: L-histidine N(alpha)-methyltransferase [Saprospiraceae bacterium]
MNKLQTKFDKFFAQDVANGLTSFPKFLSSKYFYDAAGSQIFQQIMELEEYYLTNCEFEVFQTKKEDILELLPKSFDLIELGAGNGLKTKVLLNYFLGKGIDFTYMPIDISWDVLEALEDDLAEEMPGLSVQILHDDYFGALKKISAIAENPKVVLFLGSNIGNFSIMEAIAFLKKLRSSLHTNDYFLLGADLVKDPETILRSYSDTQGITANFNYNLLHRINVELGADFDIGEFMHHANYHPQTGETKSFLISKKAQKVWIDGLKLAVNFDAWESIFMEISQKFTISQVNEMAKKSGFKVQRNFFDSKMYFTDSLWKAV